MTSWLLSKWCQWFGHSFSNFSVLLFKIELNAKCSNPDWKPSIQCRLCGKTFYAKIKK